MSGIKDGFVMKRLVVLCMALVTALAVSAPASARCREAGSLNGLRYEVRLGWGGYPAADVANFGLWRMFRLPAVFFNLR